MSLKRPIFCEGLVPPYCTGDARCVRADLEGADERTITNAITHASTRHHGAVLREITNYLLAHKLPFTLSVSFFTDPNLIFLNWRTAKDDIILNNTYVAMALPNVKPEDEVVIQGHFQKMIKFDYKKDVLESWDRLWEKCLSKYDFSDKYQYDSLLKLYRKEDIQEADVEHENEVSSNVIHTVVTVGVRRHVKQLFSHIKRESIAKLSGTNTHFRTKLLSFTLRSNMSFCDILQLVPDTNQAELAVLRAWYADIGFLNSRIIKNEATALASEPGIQSVVIPKLLSMMERSTVSRESQEVPQAVDSLMRSLSREMAELDSVFAFIPILTGSASEGSKPFYNDEFDYLLHFLHESWKSYDTNIISNNLYTFRDNLRNILEQRANHLCKDSRLVFDQFLLECDGLYPCLRLTWIGSELKDMTFSIDMVPSIDIDTPVNFPFHSYLPPSLHLRDGMATASDTTQRIHSNCGTTSKAAFQGSLSEYRQHNLKCYDSVRLLHDTRVNLGTSVIENHIIKSLPKVIRDGYKLAKAMRITLIIQSIVPQLIELDVTSNIHNVIKTYYLKTCVLFLTETYVHDQSCTESAFDWAIFIYETLRECLIERKIPQFFDKKLKFSCSCTQFGNRRNPCCRLRLAMLLIIDKIQNSLIKYRNSLVPLQPLNLHMKQCNKGINSMLRKI